MFDKLSVFSREFGLRNADGKRSGREPSHSKWQVEQLFRRTRNEESPVAHKRKNDISYAYSRTRSNSSGGNTTRGDKARVRAARFGLGSMKTQTWLKSPTKHNYLNFEYRGRRGRR